MEYEVRFYYSNDSKDKIIERLNSINDLKCIGTFYEKTIQYNSTLEGNDFYSKKIDGRYRVRISKGENDKNLILSFKRRLSDTTKDLINKEEEVECRINPDDYDNFIYITENVLKLERVESYERYRTNYISDDVIISIDEYPFSLALEIEAKTNTNQDKIIDKYVKLLNLDYKDSYRLSWDDKYEELCIKQNIPIVKDVLFSEKNMPKMEE